MHIHRAALLALLALVVPTNALAAPTATFTDRTLTVTGEAADETLTIVQVGTHVRVTGPAGMNDPDGPGVICAAFESGTEASCVDANVDSVVVNGGAGKDTLADTRVLSLDSDTLDGGAGGDKLTGPIDGGPRLMTLIGGEGDDLLIRNRLLTDAMVLHAGPGDDTLDAGAGGAFGPTDHGDAGDDTYVGSPQERDFFVADPGADTYNGGTRTPEPGEDVDDPEHYQLFDATDQIRYDDAVLPVVVTLDGRANDGAAGEADNVKTDVEKIVGGSAGDQITAGPHPAEIDGGAGNDRLVGGNGGDALFGDSGSDLILGMAGDDTLDDGDDTREMEQQPPPAAGNDRLDGGPGRDFLATDRGADDLVGGAGYDSTEFVRIIPRAPTAPPPSLPAPFVISLDDHANDGQRGAGEGDNVHTDIEEVFTGAGDDVLAGSAGPDSLAGFDGNDRIDPGPGVDSVYAGRGNDSISLVDQTTDRVDCEQGTDRVDLDLPGAQPDRADVAVSCETVTGRAFGPLAVRDLRAPRLTLKGPGRRVTRKTFNRGLRLRIGADEPVAMEVSLLVSPRRATIAKRRQITLASVSLRRAGGTRRVTLKPAGKLTGRRAIKAQVRVVAFDGAGNRAVKKRSFTIRR